MAPSGFAALLHPLPVERFESEIYDRRPAHVPAAGRIMAPPLTVAAIRRWLAMGNLWTAESLRLYRDGKPVPPAAYCTVPDAVRPGLLRPGRMRVAALLAEGAALVLNQIDDFEPPLAAIAAMLEDRFGGKVGANLYYSQAGVDAFPMHYDPHQVFVLQIAGRKRWHLYAAREEHPVKDRPARETPAASATLAEPVLGPGDLLYVPRGLYHRASAVDGASIHLTFSVQERTGLDLIDLLRSLAAGDARFRAPLPLPSADAAARIDHGRRLLAALAALFEANAPAVEASIREAQAAAPHRRGRVDLPGIADPPPEPTR